MMPSFFDYTGIYNTWNQVPISPTVEVTVKKINKLIHEHKIEFVRSANNFEIVKGISKGLITREELSELLAEIEAEKRAEDARKQMYSEYQYSQISQDSSQYQANTTYTTGTQNVYPKMYEIK